jgi:hypothetical protein
MIVGVRIGQKQSPCVLCNLTHGRRAAHRQEGATLSEPIKIFSCQRMLPFADESNVI